MKTIHSKHVAMCFLVGSHLLVRWIQEGTTTVVPVARAPDDTVEGDECEVKWSSGKPYTAIILKKGELLDFLHIFM